jgi:hypothetical protein
MIITFFYGALPNLKFVCAGWYGGEDLIRRSDGVLGRYCCDGNIRFGWSETDPETGDKLEDKEWYLH